MVKVPVFLFFVISYFCVCVCVAENRFIVPRNTFLQLFPPLVWKQRDVTYSVQSRPGSPPPWASRRRQGAPVSHRWGWLVKKKKQVGEKSQRLREAEADGRAMQRRSIVPADLAEAFPGGSRGDVPRNQEWKSKQKKRLSADGVA